MAILGYACRTGTGAQWWFGRWYAIYVDSDNFATTIQYFHLYLNVLFSLQTKWLTRLIFLLGFKIQPSSYTATKIIFPRSIYKFYWLLIMFPFTARRNIFNAWFFMKLWLQIAPIIQISMSQRPFDQCQISSCPCHAFHVSRHFHRSGSVPASSFAWTYVLSCSIASNSTRKFASF